MLGLGDVRRTSLRNGTHGLRSTQIDHCPREREHGTLIQPGEFRLCSAPAACRLVEIPLPGWYVMMFFFTPSASGDNRRWVAFSFRTVAMTALM